MVYGSYVGEMTHTYTKYHLLRNSQGRFQRATPKRIVNKGIPSIVYLSNKRVVRSYPVSTGTIIIVVITYTRVKSYMVIEFD